MVMTRRKSEKARGSGGNAGGEEAQTKIAETGMRW